MKIKDLVEKVIDGTIISDIELQRAIIYNSEKQELVINSVMNDIPLPSFYLWENTSKEIKGKFEVLDGKQRITALVGFVKGNIQYEEKPYSCYDTDFQNKFKNVDLKIIICKGDNKLKREIFKRINTLGVPLSAFEVLNGLFSGEYLNGFKDVLNSSVVKKMFGTNNRGKVQMEIFKILKSVKKIDDIHKYLEANQNKSLNQDYDEIRPYFNFVHDIFDKYINKEILFKLSFNYLKNKTIWNDKHKAINNALKNYLESDDYKLTNDKYVDYDEIIQSVVGNISVDPKRIFTNKDKSDFAKKNGTKCSICGSEYSLWELEMDHKKAWSRGGPTTISNAQLLCRTHNRSKGKKKNNKQKNKQNVYSNQY